MVVSAFVPDDRQTVATGRTARTGRTGKYSGKTVVPKVDHPEIVLDGQPGEKLVLDGNQITPSNTALPTILPDDYLTDPDYADLYRYIVSKFKIVPKCRVNRFRCEQQAKTHFIPPDDNLLYTFYGGLGNA